MSEKNEWCKADTCLGRTVKDGDTQKQSNDRPASLLNIVYKLYAIIVRKRLANHIDELFAETQYGFRQNRCPTHALFVACRLQDTGELWGDSVVLALLDQEKALETVAHSRFWETLGRFITQDTIYKVLADTSSSPTFVKDKDQAPTTKCHGAGIRQGCPLSPWLFIVVAALLQDVHLNEHPLLINPCLLIWGCPWV